MRRTVIPIMIFVVGQLASVAVLVLWVVWCAIADTAVSWLLLGIFLMISVIGGSSLVFAYWTKFRLMDDERVNFISGVSHELLTPLASLRLYTETMQIRDIDAQKQEEFLILMLEDIERLSGSISGILAASKLERGKAVYHFERRNLAEFVQNFIDSSASIIGKAEIRSDITEACFCMIDEPSMTAVMNNLIGNAIRYSPAPASIAIGMQLHDDGKALISVADEGEGLAQKDRKKIFKMFYRASQKHVGTGIGLYSVRQIVKAHKGKVWAQSLGLGKGTTINILLPTAQKGEE